MLWYSRWKKSASWESLQGFDGKKNHLNRHDEHLFDGQTYQQEITYDMYKDIWSQKMHHIISYIYNV